MSIVLKNEIRELRDRIERLERIVNVLNPQVRTIAGQPDPGILPPETKKKRGRPAKEKA